MIYDGSSNAFIYVPAACCNHSYGGSGHSHKVRLCVYRTLLLAITYKHMINVTKKEAM
jgi:hypothetical protein